MTRIFINPDGSIEIGLLLVILASTRVEYAQQCGGTANEIRRAEGFLIPVGGSREAAPFCEWFWRHTKNSGQLRWNANRFRELSDLVAAVACWLTPTGSPLSNERLLLSLDTDRLAECTEAWVPVKTPHGPGYLLWENSD